MSGYYTVGIPYVKIRYAMLNLCGICRGELWIQDYLELYFHTMSNCKNIQIHWEEKNSEILNVV